MGYASLHNICNVFVCLCRSGSGQCAGGRLSADVCGLQGEVWWPEEPQTAAHCTAVHLYLTTLPCPPLTPHHPTLSHQPQASAPSPPAPLWQGEVHAGTQDWNILVRGRVVRRTGASAGFPSLSSYGNYGSPWTEWQKLDTKRGSRGGREGQSGCWFHPFPSKNILHLSTPPR